MQTENLIKQLKTILSFEIDKKGNEYCTVYDEEWDEVLELLKKKPKPELYENETELKKAAAELLSKLPRCELFKTDNQGRRVGGGVRVKSREPGMTDFHLCIRGLFVALEAKMPGKDLDPKLKQPEYRDKVLRGEGIHIVYHSLHELAEELKKHHLVSRNFNIG